MHGIIYTSTDGTVSCDIALWIEKDMGVIGTYFYRADYLGNL